MQMLGREIKVGIYQLLWGTHQLLCCLREEHKPYKENTSRLLQSNLNVWNKPEPEFWQTVPVSIISACNTGSDIKATM